MNLNIISELGSSKAIGYEPLADRVRPETVLPSMLKRRNHSFMYVRSIYAAVNQRTILAVLLVLSLLIIPVSCNTGKVNPSVTLATTTSVEDSGLLGFLKPQWEKDTGLDVKVVAQGTGQAIKTGENGDADLLLIHDKKSEEKFVSEGNGLERIELMYNYFVIVGPKDDPAGIKNTGEANAAKALRKIMEQKNRFISRGDESGTHKKELALWKAVDKKPAGEWYISAGKGMGAVLSMASEKKAYTLTDRATFLTMKDKLDLEIVLDGANDLLNQYTIIAVNPSKHKGINGEGAQKLIQWITSKKALALINEYGKDKYGESLFIVNYKK